MTDIPWTPVHQPVVHSKVALATTAGVHHRHQQAAVLAKALEAYESIDTPGQIVDVEWRWRRKSYPSSPWHSRPAACRAA